jgi:hypothetical protein
MLAVPSTICGRQLAAPTQNVDKHVARNNTSGSSTRRRGGDRKYESSNCGKDRDGGAAARSTEGATGGTINPEEFSSDCPFGDSPATGGVADTSCGNCGSGGLGVLMGE